MSERAQANRHLSRRSTFRRSAFPIRAGRDFDERDTFDVPHVAIVNETFAQAHFPRRRSDRADADHGHGATAVADRRPRRLTSAARRSNDPPDADYFLPSLQRPERSPTSSSRHAPAVDDRAAVRERCARSTGSAAAPAADVRRRIAQTVADRKLALCCWIVRALALLLASLGSTA
jgi:hypothetical protein